MTQTSHRLPAATLAACSLGTVLCPAPFIVLGARDELLPTTSLIVSSVFMLSAGFLLARLVGSKFRQPAHRAVLGMIEVASWVTVAALLLFVSQIHLLRGLARWGSVSMFFLVASAICFPLVWTRPTAIEHRLARLPRALVVVALFAVLALSGITLYLFLTTPARFI